MILNIENSSQIIAQKDGVVKGFAEKMNLARENLQLYPRGRGKVALARIDKRAK